MFLVLKGVFFLLPLTVIRAKRICGLFIVRCTRALRNFARLIPPSLTTTVNGDPNLFHNFFFCKILSLHEPLWDSLYVRLDRDPIQLIPMNIREAIILPERHRRTIKEPQSFFQSFVAVAQAIELCRLLPVFEDHVSRRRPCSSHGFG